MSGLRFRTITLLLVCVVCSVFALPSAMAQSGRYGGHWAITLTASGSTYSAITPNGPSGTDDWSNVTQSYNPDSIQPAYSYNYINGTQQLAISASGTVHVHCEWVDYYGDPITNVAPPTTSISLHITSTASYNAYNFSENAPRKGTGHASNGLGDACVENSTGGVSSGAHDISCNVSQNANTGVYYADYYIGTENTPLSANADIYGDDGTPDPPQENDAYAGVSIQITAILN